MQQTLSLLTIYQVPSLTKQSKQIDTRGISTITIIIATITPEFPIMQMNLDEVSEASSKTDQD